VMTPKRGHRSVSGHIQNRTGCIRIVSREGRVLAAHATKVRGGSGGLVVEVGW